MSRVSFRNAHFTETFKNQAFNEFEVRASMPVSKILSLDLSLWSDHSRSRKSINLIIIERTITVSNLVENY